MFFSLLPIGVLAAEGAERKNGASLVMEYGLDSLERRYYHPVFRFDFPSKWGNLFSEVQYHSRMNGRLQGAIDYWVNVGVQKTVREKWTFELRLNHFCRHETVRATPYVWNLNEVLGKVGLAGRNFDLALAVGGFTGGSEGYRQLAVMSAEWRGFFIPELALAAELKWVNFTRFFHEWGYLAGLEQKHRSLFQECPAL